MMASNALIFLAVITSCNGAIAFQVPHNFNTHSKSQLQLNLAPQQLGEFEPIVTSAEDRTRRRAWLYDYVSSPDSSTISYDDMWDHQKSLVGHQLSRIGKRPKDPPLYDQFIPMDVNSAGDCSQDLLLGCDSIIMVEHDPVYTLGTASDASFIHGYHANGDDNKEEEVNTDNESIIPIVRIERGGEVTYHGPGQLVVYPIIDLRGYNQDIHWYMRALEEVIILALEKAGIKGVSYYFATRSCGYYFIHEVVWIVDQFLSFPYNSQGDKRRQSHWSLGFKKENCSSWNQST